MSPDNDNVADLEETLHDEEKTFLMEKYASMLLLQLDLEEDGMELDDKTVESLLVARSQVSADTAGQIVALLEAHGHEAGDLDIEGEEEEGLFGEDDVDGEERAEGGALISDNGNLGNNGSSDTVLADGSGSDDLFSEDGDEGEHSADELDDVEVDGLFDDDSEADVDAEDEDTEAVAAGVDDLEDEAGDDDDGDASGLFDSEDETESTAEAADTKAGEELDEDEEAGVLFDQDIYAGREGSGAEDGETEDGETPESTPTEGHTVEDTPGFTPTEGHTAEDTPDKVDYDRMSRVVAGLRKVVAELAGTE